MIALKRNSFVALAGGALFIGFFGFGPVDFRMASHLHIRCDLQPDISLAQEISECHDIIAEEVYEGEALGEVYFRLGYFNDRLGKWQIAYEYYQTAREMRPNRVSAHYNSAMILGRHTQDWEGVVDATSAVIDLVPPRKSDHSNAWVMRAYALLMLGRGEEAIADIKIAQTIDPDRRELFLLLDRLDEVEQMIAQKQNDTDDHTGLSGLQETLLLLARVFVTF
ncbi:MAG: hypothetical protein AB8B47_09940 [Roseobacter sp.]